MSYFSVAPNALVTIAAGQKPVKADCNKLKPTKPVSHNQLAFWKKTEVITLEPNSNETITSTPAIAETALLIVIFTLF